MPIYEYYCESCNGIYEAVRPMREASSPSPCPECGRDGRRVMPTTFTAFTFREGYPRRLPDKGTYWHLGKEVKRRIDRPFRMNEHPELNPPRPPPRKSKGDLEVEREKTRLRRKEERKMLESGGRPPAWKRNRK